MKQSDKWMSIKDARSLAAADHGNPFEVLGPHGTGEGWVVRALAFGAEAVKVISAGRGELGTLEPVGEDGVFAGPIAGAPGAYRLRRIRGAESREAEDPYRFGPVLGEMDEHLLGEGKHQNLWRMLGAHPIRHEGVAGVHFSVWAPNARRVSLVGDFNSWDGRCHPMRRRGSSGVWEIFMPGLGTGTLYKFEIRSRDGTVLPLKADPVGFGAEHPPRTASVVRDLPDRDWQDSAWMNRRGDAQNIDSPISIYEVHLGSWRRRREENNRFLSYLELADELVPYVVDLGFTHIELLPIAEHPFGGSWGYQPLGLYAPTVRHGTADEFRGFVESAHLAGLGVILDWVPGHFPADAHGLAQFDGTALYEHADPREGFHPDWNTMIFNHGRREVANYLMANARYWLKEYHLDGLRVDAVASMLYRDYSRRDGEWIPNRFGGRENLEAVAFLKRMNELVYAADRSVMTIAEESTAWPGVSRPTNLGGLGFGYKWNMGWMNDTLEYMRKDPIHRSHHHRQMSFGFHYAFSENFILPISHDEVVHGKGSLLARMPGNTSERFAGLRAYLGFMWGHPGKKLLFMGQELAQPDEWNHDAEIDWDRLTLPAHSGMQRLVRDLNRIYRESPALHRSDCDAEGFSWIEADAENISVFAWERRTAGEAPVVVVCNFTPIERRALRFGVPESGFWIERLNTDATEYGGGGSGNLGGVDSRDGQTHGRGQFIEITLPPLSTLMFEHARG